MQTSPDPARTPDSAADAAAAGLSRQGWKAASLLLVGSSLVSKALGVLRDILVANYFGAASAVDALQVAVSVALLLGAGTGAAIATAIVPVYQRIALYSGVGPARKFAGQIGFLSALCSLALAALIAWRPEAAVSIAAPNLPPRTFSAAVELVRPLAILVVGLNISSIGTALFHAQHHFKLPVFAELCSQVSVVASLGFLAGTWGIRALAWGLIWGSVLMVVIQAAPLARMGFLRPGTRPVSAELRGFLAVFVPILLSDYAIHAQLFLQNFLSSGLPVGSIASLSYANGLRTAVITLVATNVARGAFPRISELASAARLEDLRRLVHQILKYTILFFVPLSFFCVLKSADIVRGLFLRGRFDEEASRSTAQAFAVYAAGFLLSGAMPVLLRVCYAAGRVRSSLVAMLTGLASFYLLSRVLLPHYGMPGLAAAGTLALAPSVMLLALVARYHLGPLGGRSLAGTILASCVLSGLSLLPCIFLPARTLPALLLSGACFGLLYAGLGVLFLRKDFLAVWALLARRGPARTESA